MKKTSGGNGNSVGNPDTKVQPTRVLVCTIADCSSKFEQEALSDVSIYKKYYPNVIFKSVQDVRGLIDLIKSRNFDAVHILADVSLQGTIGELTVNEILDSCMKNKVLIVFLASSVPKNIDMKHFKSGPFHLIITLDRKGTAFGGFLDSILSQLSNCKSLPVAWVNISPQISNLPVNNVQPECVLGAAEEIMANTISSASMRKASYGKKGRKK